MHVQYPSSLRKGSNPYYRCRQKPGNHHALNHTTFINIPHEEDDEERNAVEREIAKFEPWVEKVRPFLLDESYTPSYEEKRLAVRILGLRVTVYPTTGDYPYRYQIDVTVPEITGKIKRYYGADQPL
jgi:hypothetical protein